MKTRERYGVYHFDRGWLKDTCGEGAYTGFDTVEEGEAQAKTWNSPSDAITEIDGCDLELGTIGESFEVVPINEPWQPLMLGVFGAYADQDEQE